MANYLSYLQPAANLISYMSTPSKKPIETVNIEGFTSAIRLAMFPYAVSAKVKVDEFAINFDFPNKYWIFDTKSVSRYFANEGRKNFVIVKRIARIMIDLFPPIPQEKGQKLEAITNIYRHVIFGLEKIQAKFFADQKKHNTVPVVSSFDFDFDLKYEDLTEAMAGEAIQETINLFKYCCKHKVEPLQDPSPLQIDVKNSYINLSFFELFSRQLDLLENVQEKILVDKEWRCENEFHSLNFLIEGRIANHKKIIDLSNKMVSEKQANNLLEGIAKRNTNSPIINNYEVTEDLKEKVELQLEDDLLLFNLEIDNSDINKAVIDNSDIKESDLGEPYDPNRGI